MSCDSQAVVNDSACDFCAIPDGMVDYAILAMLCALRDGDTMACSPQAIASEASCLMCSIPQGMVKYSILATLCSIAGGGGIGGGGQIKQYTTANPNTEGVLPDDQTKPAIAYKDDANGATWSWNTTSHVWQ